MLKNLSLGKKLSLISLVAIVLLGFLEIVSIVRYNNLLNKTLQQQDNLSSLLFHTKTTQAHFKMQVQEWKNILIRGHQREKYDKHIAGFKDQMNRVQKHLGKAKAIVSNFKNTQHIEQEINKFFNEWNRANEAYFLALKKTLLKKMGWSIFIHTLLLIKKFPA